MNAVLKTIPLTMLAVTSFAFAAEPARPVAMTAKMHWTPKVGESVVVWEEFGKDRTAVSDRMTCERLAVGDGTVGMSEDGVVNLPSGTKATIVKRHYREPGFAGWPAVELHIDEGDYKGKQYWMLQRDVARLVPAKFADGDSVVIGRPNLKSNVWVSQKSDVAHLVSHAIRSNADDYAKVDNLADNNKIFVVGRGTPAKVVHCWDEICLISVTNGKYTGQDIWVDVRYLSSATHP